VYAVVVKDEADALSSSIAVELHRLRGKRALCVVCIVMVCKLLIT
jgi:hypothetical protein